MNIDAWMARISFVLMRESVTVVDRALERGWGWRSGTRRSPRDDPACPGTGASAW